MIARAVKWGALLAVLALAAAVLAEPLFWKRYVTSLVYDPSGAPLWFYSPRAVVKGAESSGPPRVTPDEQQVEPAALEAAADYAAAHGSHALIVSRRSHIVYEKYWHGTSAETLVNAQEMSAVLTSLMLGVALRESKVGSIDEPAANYLAEWRDDGRSRIRIRDLLQMSSGLEPAGAGPFPWSASVRERIGNDILAPLWSRGSTARPGERWTPQMSDPQLLALVIERATGMPYARYLSENLWRRIGAADAYLWLDRPDGAAHAECCLLARQGDWMRIAELLSNDGIYLGEELLPPGWIGRMLTPAAGNAGYGFHVRIGSPAIPRDRQAEGSEPYAADDVFYLKGGQNRLWIAPSLRLAILRTGPARRDSEDWEDARIPNLVIRGLRDFAPPARPERSADPSGFAPHS